MNTRDHLRSTRAPLFLTLIAAAALSACAEKTPAPQYATVSQQGADQLGVKEVELAAVDPSFRGAVAEYAMHANQAKEREGAGRDSAVFAAIQSLANAIETMPRSEGLALSASAASIRATMPATSIGFTSEGQQIESSRQALETAAAALGTVASGPYVFEERVRNEVDAFHTSVRDIGQADNLRDRRDKIVDSLDKGRKALEAILVAEARRSR